MARNLDIPVFDVDNHMYETTDAFTRYMPEEYAELIKYVQVNGRTKIAVNNKITNYIPNPTFNKVGPPGAQELEFKLKNPSSKTKVKPGDIPVTKPPKYIEAPPAFFNPEDRLALMNEQGIDRAVMWPTLASLLEERLADDPVATHVAITSFNNWMHDHWSYNVDDRIFPTPIITLPILELAMQEFERVVERGARIILIRPAPVPDYNGRRRSFALPEFDPFWKLVEESGVLVGFHVSDDGYVRHMNEWDGLTGENQAFAGYTTYRYLVQAEYRSIKDTMFSVIGHGLAHRFPKIKFVSVENGSAYVKPLVSTLQKVYSRSPHLFEEDPMITMKRSIYIHPFHEEDPKALVDLVGVDNVLFGSDYPHTEGMFDPLTFIDDLDELSAQDQKKVMGGNLAGLLGFDPDVKLL